MYFRGQNELEDTANHQLEVRNLVQLSLGKKRPIARMKFVF